MAAAVDVASQLPGERGEDQGRRERREARESVVRIVEFSQYPRVSADHALQIGFTCDESASGLCIEARERTDIGELLRVTVRDVDGGVIRDGLARVVWCDDLPGVERFRMGVELLREGQRSLRRAGAERPSEATGSMGERKAVRSVV